MTFPGGPGSNEGRAPGISDTEMKSCSGGIGKLISGDLGFQVNTLVHTKRDKTGREIDSPRHGTGVIPTWVPIQAP